jgi:adenosylcobinamide kinase/adenosylcobinamide-phosphate guanylyltransferase
MLGVVTGPVRSGKSRVALDLALKTGRPVVVAVGGRADDEEMARRIRQHQADRPGDVRVIEVDADPAWVAVVPAEACLLVDCLGTVLGLGMVDLMPDDAEVAPAGAEERADSRAQALVDALLARGGDTVVVGNEVGWGIVPATPLGRLFRDVNGRAMRVLVEAADVAVLVVAGRCIDLKKMPREAQWTR